VLGTGRDLHGYTPRYQMPYPHPYPAKARTRCEGMGSEVNPMMLLSVSTTSSVAS